MSSPKMELETAELERIRSFLALPNGTKRALYEWRASDEDRPLGSLLIIHGLGEHGGRYASEAQFFAERGLHVYCMDVMGHGYSDGARGCIPSYDALLDDVEMAIQTVGQRSGNRPLALWGHSMGGNLVINYLLRRQNRPQCAIASAPMLQPGRPPGKTYLWCARMLERVLPNHIITPPVRLEDCTSVPEMQSAMRDDKLFHRRLSLRLGAALIDSGQWAIEHARQLKTSLLVAHGVHDAITSSAASIQFCLQSGALAQMALYPAYKHDLHRDVGRQEILESYFKWLNEKLRSPA